MKSTQRKASRSGVLGTSLAGCLAAIALFSGAAAARAQTAITSITTAFSDSANSTTNSTTFENSTLAVTSFSSGNGSVYSANVTAAAAYTRRNTTSGNPNQTSVWYADGTSGYASSYAADGNTVLLGNNLLRGSDNTFANGSGSNVGNIERLDFIFTESGAVATSDMVIAIFDRGEINVHDSVKVAVITGFNGSTDAPTAYGGNLVTVSSAHYGTANVVSTFDYNLFRYNQGNNLSTWTSDSETGTQGIGGTFITLADLGIAPGTTIYGYSIMGNDVTNGGSMANLVDWSNTTYYKSNTSGDTGTGGVDLAAVNGVLFKKTAVPEPGTYGLIFSGLGLTLFFGRRQRRRASALAYGRV